MNRPLVIAIAATGLVVGLLIGFAEGWRYRQFQLALQENKIAAGNLKYARTNLPPVFQEYLKARIYCNVRNYYPSKKGYLLAKDWDFGPVDRSVLGRVLIWKEPDEKVFDWASAIKDK